MKIELRAIQSVASRYTTYTKAIPLQALAGPEVSRRWGSQISR